MPKPPTTRGPRRPGGRLGSRPERAAGRAAAPGGPGKDKAALRPEIDGRRNEAVRGERTGKTGEQGLRESPRRQARPRKAENEAAAKPQRARRAAAFRGETETRRETESSGRRTTKPREPGLRERPQAPTRPRKAENEAATKPQRARRAAAFRGDAEPPRETEAPERYEDGAPQRIAKLLARAGIASRREIERMIADRRVALDGKPVETPATILTSLKGVTVDGKAVRAPSATRLFLFHKPAGLLTAERDFSGRPTIYDRLPTDLPRLMPVGRLDLNTEGLLLLTNDGEFKRQLELPKTGVERIYRARVFGEISQEQLEELIHGVEIEGVRYGPIDANMERRTGRNGWVEMKLKEGKNREVRRVLEHLGLQVSRLLRVAYGPFVLGDLPSGGIGEVRQQDIADFRKSLSALGSTVDRRGSRQ